MGKFEPRQVPDSTREITYTGRRGEQVSIRVRHGKRGAHAHPASAQDAKVLDTLIASLPSDEEAASAPTEQETTATTTTAPVTGDQEG